MGKWTGLFEGKNPLHHGSDVVFFDMGIRRHRRTAPDTRAPDFYLFHQQGFSVLVIAVLCGDFLETGPMTLRYVVWQVMQPLDCAIFSDAAVLPAANMPIVASATKTNFMIVP